MAGSARSGSPGGPGPAVAGLVPLPAPGMVRADPGKVRELRRKLWAAAGQPAERRFRALVDRICGGDVLWGAWRRVRENRGAAGVDRVTLAYVRDVSGVQRLLAGLQRDLRGGMYRPAPARRVGIPEPDGGPRPPGIPAVRDRVAQQAAKIVLEAVSEAGFLPCSCGLGPERPAVRAMGRLRTGYCFVVEFGIRDFFGEISHDRLLAEAGRRVPDRRVLKLVRLRLRAGVMAGGSLERAVAGTARGGVISPLLASICLRVLDRELAARGAGGLVRYADDGVVVCRGAAQAGAAPDAVGELLGSPGLRLHPGKTRAADLREGREGLDFLGCHFCARMPGRLWEQRRIIRYYLHRWPSQRAMKRLGDKIRARAGRTRCGDEVREVIADLNPLLRGWGNYFRTGTAAGKFIQADRDVAWRLKRLLVKKHGRNLHAGQADPWTGEWMHGMGLHELSGTIRYPKAA
jgi:RNA-directed DNA polymerase